MTNQTFHLQNRIKNELFLFFTPFLKIFDLFELSKNESFVFNPELLNSFENLNFPDWHSFYPHDRESSKKHFPFLKDLEKEMYLDIEDIEKYLMEGQVFIQLRKLATKEQRESKEGDKILLTKEQVEILLSCYAWVNFFLIAALWGESPFELFDKAIKGDQDSILKLIQLDKSLIQSDWSMREIKKAQLAGDQDYFKKLSKAITANPFKPHKVNLKLSFVLVFGWEMDLGKLSNDEILEFVKDLGIYEGDDPDSLYREIKRLGLRKRTKREKAD